MDTYNYTSVPFNESAALSTYWSNSELIITILLTILMLLTIQTIMQVILFRRK